jgi:hypothetical protein
MHRSAKVRNISLQVPDTWHVVNSQDVIVHGMKLWGWYKRNGCRVIVNEYGDLIVRPAHFELSLLQVWPSSLHHCDCDVSCGNDDEGALPQAEFACDVFILCCATAAAGETSTSLDAFLMLQLPWRKSIKHHLLSSYYASLFAVVSSQLRKRKRHDDGTQGLLELLRDVPIMRVALKEHADAHHIALAKRLGRVSGVLSDGDKSAAAASESRGDPAQSGEAVMVRALGPDAAVSNAQTGAAADCAQHVHGATSPKGPKSSEVSGAYGAVDAAGADDNVVASLSADAVQRL